MGSLIAAYTVAWGVLMLYVLSLAARQRKLHRALRQMETAAHTQAAAPAPPHAR